MGEWIEAGRRPPILRFRRMTAPARAAFAAERQAGGAVFLSQGRHAGLHEGGMGAFRDRSKELKKLGAVVLGVSADSVESHEQFRDKFELNFPLLADEDHQVAEQYGAWREKNMYGKKSMGIQRSTFLIDPTGKVARVWKAVQVDGHDEQVLTALEELEK